MSVPLCPRDRLKTRQGTWMCRMQCDAASRPGVPEHFPVQTASQFVEPRGFSLPSLSARPKKSPALRGCFLVWRRERDSNPRYAINVYSLSRGALSTTQPSLRNQSYHYSQPADESGFREAIYCNKARYSPHPETSARLRLCSPILPILSALLLPQL